MAGEESDVGIKNSNNQFNWALSIVAIVFVCWFFWPIITTFHLLLAENLEKFYCIEIGAFGDSFGSLNALLSGLSFSMLVLTLYFQNSQMQENKKQFDLQIEESRKNLKIAISQRNISIFFELINRKNASINQVSIYDHVLKTGLVSGVNCFEVLCRIIQDSIKKAINLESESPEFDLEKTVQRRISVEIKHYKVDFDLYIKSLVSILTFLNLDAVDKEDRETFFKILHSNISLHELIFISYYLCAQMNKELHVLSKKFYLLDPLIDHLNLKGSFAHEYPDIYNAKISKFQFRKLPKID